eukprot:9494844-Pyramimonas_sp.AAC.1
MTVRRFSARSRTVRNSSARFLAVPPLHKSSAVPLAANSMPTASSSSTLERARDAAHFRSRTLSLRA